MNRITERNMALLTGKVKDGHKNAGNGFGRGKSLKKKASAVGALVIIAMMTVMLLVPVFGSVAFADEPTDEILDYEITATPMDDGKVNLVYHIDWKVLESDNLGPVSWVNIGIPNSHYEAMNALSDNIDDIYYEYDYGTMARVEFDRDYYEDEVISFDFSVVMDYLYEMNKDTDGVTAYSFTPGYFEYIAVDRLVIRWNFENVSGWSPECLVNDGYCVWETALAPDETFTVNVDYPNDAFHFDSSKFIATGEDDWGGGNDYDEGFGLIDVIAWILAIFFVLVPPAGVCVIISKAVKAIYRSTANFGSAPKTGTKTINKITRTKVKYYPVCQGCGAAREDGQRTCPYCGRSFVESEEIIEEENVAEADKETLKYKQDGEYHYSSDPDTFVRVRVVPTVVHVSTGRRMGSTGPGIFKDRGGNAPKGAKGIFGGAPSSSGGRSHSSSHSSGRSSGHHGGGGGGCAHSSCACACVSCACACACACAGGGRAGCTTKDFYKYRQSTTSIRNVGRG